MTEGIARQPLTLSALNALDEAGFVTTFGAVFEHSPWVARRAFARGPFASIDALHAAMVDVTGEATKDEQLALLRAHPELTGKAAIATGLTPASSREQRGAGLDRCTPAQFAALGELNTRYRERFGFPFIVAVKGLDVDGILAALAARVGRAHDTEITEALRQVARIARLRIDAIVAGA